MKKKGLKNLGLNKKTISNFEVHVLKAGLASIGKRCSQPTWCGSVRVSRGFGCNDQDTTLCASGSQNDDDTN